MQARRQGRAPAAGAKKRGDHLGELLAYASAMARAQHATGARLPRRFPKLPAPDPERLRAYVGRQAGVVVLHFRPLAPGQTRFRYSDLGFLAGVGYPTREGGPILASYKEEPPWDSRPRPDISDWVKRLLEHLRRYGLKPEDLLDALPTHEFHEQGKDTEVEVNRNEAAACTFFPGWCWYWWQLIHVFDGHTHTVFFPDTVAKILQGDFLSGVGLGDHSKTAIHEMLHVMLYRTRCAEDDDADEVVGLYEEAIAATVAYHEAKAQYGPNNGIVGTSRLRVQEIIDRLKALGADGCLQRLGIGPLP